MGRYGPNQNLMVNETAEVAELRYLIEEYDKLFEKCMTRPMTNEEHKQLNELHETLSNIEQAKWVGVSDENLAYIQDETDTDFPMILHLLGMLPTEDN